MDKKKYNFYCKWDSMDNKSLNKHTQKKSELIER